LQLLRLTLGRIVLVIARKAYFDRLFLERRLPVSSTQVGMSRDRDQPGADATVALPPRPTAQF
jgi:hypothetical protein